MRGHINDVNSAVLASVPGGTRARAGDASAGIRNTGHDADFIVAQVPSAIGVEGVVEHMPVESRIGVVDFLSGSGTAPIRAPRHQHAVRGHDLDLVPASPTVFGSNSYGRPHSIG